MQEKLKQIAEEMDIEMQFVQTEDGYVLRQAEPGLVEFWQISEFLELGLSGIRATERGSVEYVFSTERYNWLRGERD